MALVEFWFFECSKIYGTSPDYKLNPYIENGVSFDFSNQLNLLYKFNIHYYLVVQRYCVLHFIVLSVN
jgi:hypothetical protein